MKYIHTKEIQDILYCYFRWEQNSKYAAENEGKVQKSVKALKDMQSSRGKNLPEMAQIFGIDNPYHRGSYYGLKSKLLWLALHFVALQLLFLFIFEDSHPIFFTVCYIAALIWTSNHSFFENNLLGPDYLKDRLESEREKKEMEYLAPRIEAYQEEINDQLNKGDLFRVLLSEEHGIVLCDDEIQFTEGYYTCTVRLDCQTEVLPYYVVKAHDYNAIRLATQMMIMQSYYPNHKIIGEIKYKNHEKPTNIFIDDKTISKLAKVISVITGLKEMDREDSTAYRCFHCSLRNQCDYVNSEVKNYIGQRA